MKKNTMYVTSFITDVMKFSNTNPDVLKKYNIAFPDLIFELMIEEGKETDNVVLNCNVNLYVCVKN